MSATRAHLPYLRGRGGRGYVNNSPLDTENKNRILRNVRLC